MKEILTDTETGERMVTRYTLTQSGVKVSSFKKANPITAESGNITEEEYDAAMKTDYDYESSSIVSSQTNWLNAEITIYKKIALCKPTLEVINPFSELSKILIMANNNIVKVFSVGGLTGTVNLDFLENDELITDSENSEDTAEYFKSSGFMATTIDGWASPIILNPYSVNNPSTVTITLIGNTDPAASGIFRVSIRAINE